MKKCGITPTKYFSPYFEENNFWISEELRVQDTFKVIQTHYYNIHAGVCMVYLRQLNEIPSMLQKYKFC